MFLFFSREKLSCSAFKLGSAATKMVALGEVIYFVEKLIPQPDQSLR